MLFRAIADKETITDLMQKYLPGQHPIVQQKIVARMIDPDLRAPFCVSVPTDEFDKIHQETQATAGRIVRDPNTDKPMHAADTIWVSDHDGQSIYTALSEYDVFFHREV